MAHGAMHVPCRRGLRLRLAVSGGNVQRYRIVIVVLAAEGAYAPTVKAIRETWGASVPSDILLLYNYAERRDGRPDVSVEGDRLISNGDETYHGISLKAAQAIDYVSRNYTFDYLVRCCCGSYLHIGNLRRHLADKPTTGFYSGFVGTAPWLYGRHRFCSGSCYFLSYDVAQRIAANLGKWDVSIMDDLALGKLAKRVGIRIHASARRVDLGKLIDPDADIAAAMKNDRSFDSHYHFHFRNDASYMHKLHEHFARDRVRLHDPGGAEPVAVMHGDAAGAVSVAGSSAVGAASALKPFGQPLLDMLADPFVWCICLAVRVGYLLCKGLRLPVPRSRTRG